MTVNDEKKQNRQLAHSVLLKISESDKLTKSESATANLLDILNQLNPSLFNVVGIFSPMKDEVKWTKFKEKFNIWSLAFPMMNGEKLEFFKVENKAIHDWGADFPENFQKIKIEPQIIIVPGLFFSKSGMRLGRGKGFYDRFLQNFKGVKIGLCFEEQIMDHIPIDAHDEKMNFIVTDINIYKV